MNRPPFATLKLSLSLVLAAVLLTSGAALWSRSLSHDAETRLQQQNSALNAAQQQLDRSQQQQRLIATHLAAYQALVARGFVGAEDRLTWIEAAQHANRDAGLYGLNYHLAPRAAALPAFAQGLPLGQTTMTLTMPLLVETDLPRFLAALKARASGVYHVQGCRLSRLVEAAFNAASPPQLQAECELLWFTVSDQTEAGK
jgi:hypothetical protein